MSFLNLRVWSKSHFFLWYDKVKKRQKNSSSAAFLIFNESSISEIGFLDSMVVATFNRHCDASELEFEVPTNYFLVFLLDGWNQRKASSECSTKIISRKSL